MSTPTGKTRITRPLFDRMLGLYRASPGSHSYVAKTVGCSLGMARRAWFRGWPKKKWGAPISEQLRLGPSAARDVPEQLTGKETRELITEMRVRLEPANEPSTTDAVLVVRAPDGSELDLTAARRDALTIKLLDAVSARHAARSGALLLETISELTASCLPLGRLIAQRVTELVGSAEPTDLKDLIAVIESVVRLHASAVQGYAAARALGIEALGDVRTDEPDISIEESIEIARVASSAAERAYAKLQRRRANPKQKPMLEVVEQ